MDEEEVGDCYLDHRLRERSKPALHHVDTPPVSSCVSLCCPYHDEERGKRARHVDQAETVLQREWDEHNRADGQGRASYCPCVGESCVTEVQLGAHRSPCWRAGIELCKLL